MEDLDTEKNNLKIISYFNIEMKEHRSTFKEKVY